MDRMTVSQLWNKKVKVHSPYPLWSILLAMGLLYLSPFLTPYLVYPAFILCAYRIIAYDAKVFSADYALLIGMNLLFRTPDGMSLLVYLALLADIWYFIRYNFPITAIHFLLLILLNYFLLRMQWNISNFLLCFGHLFLLCILIPEQDSDSAERTAKLFCVGLILSSSYALLFRNTPQLQAIVGKESLAFWNSSFYRFQSLFSDPNYYMMLLITGMALLMKLKICNRIRSLPFCLMELALFFFGVLTYSKTFLLAAAFLALLGIVWLFHSRRYVLGISVVVTLLAGLVILILSSQVFRILLLRLTTFSDLSDLTSGRSDVFSEYFKVITESPQSTLFGVGFANEGLGKDPHNLFLEIIYYTGFVGLVLFAAYYIAIVLELCKRPSSQQQGFFLKFFVLLMVLLLHCTLHGMFFLSSYFNFYLAFLALLIPPKASAAVPPGKESCHGET